MDTQTLLWQQARERAEAARRAAQELAIRKITRNRMGYSAEDLAEILAALGLDGEQDRPPGLCRICGNPQPSDGRKACRRERCVAERLRIARALDGPEA